MELNENNINEILNNGANVYYGHGTIGDMDIIKSIFNIGLRCSHGSMYFTTICLGVGSEIGSKVYEMMNNWPHLESKKIVIVSAPLKYNIMDTPSLGTWHQSTNAYCYKIEKRGKYVMPEFIAGYYDADTKIFTQNPKYYEMLSKDEQIELFNKVKLNYIETLENACGLEYYKNLLEKCDLPIWKFPLSEEEINVLTSNHNTKKI